MAGSRLKWKDREWIWDHETALRKESGFSLHRFERYLYDPTVLFIALCATMKSITLLTYAYGIRATAS